MDDVVDILQKLVDSNNTNAMRAVLASVDKHTTDCMIRTNIQDVIENIDDGNVPHSTINTMLDAVNSVNDEFMQQCLMLGWFILSGHESV